MTILPNKHKKVTKGIDRHGLQQLSNRNGIGHSHRQQSITSLNAENRKIAILSNNSRNAIATSARNAPNKVTYHHANKSPEIGEQQMKNASPKDGHNQANNSDDEYGQGFIDERLEIWFKERLHHSKGFEIKPVQGDGACLFRAVADQIYGNEDMHSHIRCICMDYMEKHSDHFSQFVTENFNDYIKRKRRSDEHGNHMELQAISEVFGRAIEIYEYCIEPRNISSSRFENPNAGASQSQIPIRLSYHGASHYNSVIDPTAPKIGLTSYFPSVVDQREASRSSEANVEDQLVTNQINMTDLERTEQELEEQIAQQSYIDYLKGISDSRNTENNRIENDKMISCSSQPGSSRQESEVGSLWNDAAGTDAEESALLAQMMALSQQEFLNSLKRKHPSMLSEDDQAGSSKSC